MTVKLPQKAGFVPTVAEWDALVRIAENLAAQVVQRDAESLKATFDAHEKINQLSGDLYGAQMALAQAQAERAASRAEVARLTERANKLASALSLVVFAMPDAAVELAREAWGNTNTNNVNDALENAHNVLGTSDPEDAGDMAMPQGGALNGN